MRFSRRGNGADLRIGRKMDLQNEKIVGILLFFVPDERALLVPGKQKRTENFPNTVQRNNTVKRHAIQNSLRSAGG